MGKIYELGNFLTNRFFEGPGKGMNSKKRLRKKTNEDAVFFFFNDKNFQSQA